jgi:hypothetical protein
MSTEPAPPTPKRRAASPGMRFVRVWMPVLIVLSGLLLGIIGGTDAAWEGGALLISAGVSVWVLNLLFRVGVRGDRERTDEEAAREHFERTGRWPDEKP